MNDQTNSNRPVDGGIAVILPCFQVERSVARVLEGIGPEVSVIYCVDDASTDGTVTAILNRAESDSRVTLLRRPHNGGVGAAMIDGYLAALRDDWTILVKLDADGQMNPGLIADLTAQVRSGEADYVKGNRFYSAETIHRMPIVRVLGNAGVSYLSKMSSGYWQLFDPTNGFTALHANVARALPFEKIHRRYFFESDMLFRLYIIRAKVLEWPMRSAYSEEESNLSELHSLLVFPFLHVRNALKRLVYTYFLRNFSLASANLVVGIVFVVASAAFGASAWIGSYTSGIPATAGTVMLSALPFLVGVQLILSFLAHDMTMVPSEPIQRQIARLVGSSLSGKGAAGNV